jgi:CheY-like chemotaxis protein
MAKVLVVDDEPSVLLSTSLLLSDLGHAVVTTTQANDVLSTMRRERPDVLLQDVRMPGLDLPALMRQVRADPDVGGTPIVLFSASMNLLEVQGEVGADGVLEKPFRPDDLLAAIESVVPPPPAKAVRAPSAFAATAAFTARLTPELTRRGREA